MDKERFNTLLADMDMITDTDIKSLNQLRKQYPYFQNQYVMIAKALKKRNHPKTDAFIKKAAIYSADRALLKAIIMDEHNFTPVVEEAEESDQAQEVSAVPATSDQKAPEIAEEEAVVEKKLEEAPADPKVKAPIVKPIPQAEEVATVKVEEPSHEAKAVPKPEPIKPPVVHIPEPKVEKTPPPPPEKPTTTVKAESTTPEKPGEKRESNQDLIDELERDLKEIRKKKQLIAKMLEQQEAKQSAKKVAPAKKKTATAKTSQSELIEKFIQNEPQMGKQKLVHDESVHQHEDLAARYTQAQEDFYTETMARLMVTQKKYRKAIQIYENLGLKFPEKRTYFASQIEKVKNRSNV